MIGQTLGSYTLERELGRGGMGAVYAAVHGLLGRRAAVKVLLAELSRDQPTVQRFFNEARAATAIKHPSIVEIYDFGFAPDGAAYIVMELMEGESLATRLRRLGRLPVANALVIARQIATALAAAHRAGIVHRDLKPDNAFLVADPEVAGGERVKLLDFGIAKLVTETVGVAKTTTGAIMGTPHYMSPEQCEGSRAVDHRSDLYSLGVMLFQMITGRLPFVGEGVGGIIGAHLFVAPPALRSLAPDAPAEVEAFVARLLAKTADERPQSADEVVAALGRLGAHSSGLAAPVVVTRPPHDPSLGDQPTLPTPSPAPAPAPTTLSAATSRPPPDEPIEPPRRSRRGIVLALVAAAAVVAVAAIAIAAGGRHPRAAASPDAAVAVAVDAAGGASLLAEAQRAIAERHWDDAVALAHLLERDGDPSAAAILSRATSGKIAADGLAAMQTALAAKDFHPVRVNLDAVYDNTLDGDPDRARADAIMAEAKPAALASIGARVAKLAKQGACADARELAATAATDWGVDEAKAMTRAAKQCKPSKTGDVVAPAPQPVPDPVPPTEPTEAELIGKIKEAIATGQWKVASLRCGTVSRDVVRKRLAFDCTLAACKAGDALDPELLGRIPPIRQKALRRACGLEEAPEPIRDPPAPVIDPPLPSPVPLPDESAN